MFLAITSPAWFPPRLSYKSLSRARLLRSCVSQLPLHFSVVIASLLASTIVPGTMPLRVTPRCGAELLHPTFPLLIVPSLCCTCCYVPRTPLIAVDAALRLRAPSSVVCVCRSSPKPPLLPRRPPPRRHLIPDAPLSVPRHSRGPFSHLAEALFSTRLCCRRSTTLELVPSPSPFFVIAPPPRQSSMPWIPVLCRDADAKARPDVPSPHTKSCGQGSLLPCSSKSRDRRWHVFYSSATF
jgi:hypothetical protein